MGIAEDRAFIRAHTRDAAAPLVPEIRLRLADGLTTVWEATEAAREPGQPPPFWAFPWPGGQALARLILDHPALVAGRDVLDFACGCGISTIAALKAGAARVTASEIDAYARAATLDAADLNGFAEDDRLTVTLGDLVGGDGGWDVVIAGDVCYEREPAERITAWLRGLAARGGIVLLADPGRQYAPTDALQPLAAYSVPTSLEVERATTLRTQVLRMI